MSFRNAEDNGLLVAWLGGFSAPSWLILALLIEGEFWFRGVSLSMWISLLISSNGLVMSGYISGYGSQERTGEQGHASQCICGDEILASIHRRGHFSGTENSITVSCEGDCH